MAPRAPAPGRFPALSERERQIVRATAGGLPLVYVDQPPEDSAAG